MSLGTGRDSGVKAARIVAGVVAAIGWVYSWYLFRGIRNQYARVDIGSMPLWLLIIMGLTSTALIATTVMVMLRAEVWSKLSIAAGGLLFVAIVMAPFALMSSYESQGSDGVRKCANFGPASCEQPANLASAFKAVFATRSALSAAVFVAGVPTILVLCGSSGLLLPRLTRSELNDV